MSDLTIVSVVDAGADVLLATAHDADGNELEARGWVSATTNHYDASAYRKDGSRDPKTAARAMTPTEVGEYARTLVIEQHFPDALPAAPTAIAFEA